MRTLVLCVITVLVYTHTAIGAKPAPDRNGPIFRGDMRLRHETITETRQPNRHQWRFRLRFGFDTKINSTLMLHARLASGSSDPISTNQSMGGAFSTKGIWLDQAYIEWAPATVVKVLGGKMKNPFFRPGKSGLIWDGDLRPEGIAATLRDSDSKTTTPFVTVGFFWVEERRSKNDTLLSGIQGGITRKTKKNQLVLGIGYFDYSNVVHQVTLVNPNNGFGNSTTTEPDSSTTYNYDYNEAEIFAEYTIQTVKPEISFHANVVTNTAVSSSNSGYLVGIRVGKSLPPKTWSLCYDYRRLESDAVIGAFCDSDFIGGGTNGTGHRFNLKYVAAPNTTYSITYFLDEKGIGSGITYSRLQIDFEMKF